MTEFKVGDNVKVVSDTHTLTNNGHTGVITAITGDYIWPISVQFDDEAGDDIFAARELELIENEYDQDTVNAIVKYLRDTDWHGVAQKVENKFALPKTRTVTVNFQVPEDKSVVDYLGNVGIDYDIEGGN